MAPENDSSPTDSDWERRVLCSDESCIGVIGADGRCKECGLVYEGKLPWLGVEEAQNDDGQAGEDAVIETETKVTASEDDDGLTDDPDEWEDVDDSVSDEDWERRILCSDESCIGVIGPDGRCKECGKPLKED